MQFDVERLLSEAEALATDAGFRNEVAQIQSKAILSRLGATEMPDWTYLPRRVIRNASSVTADLATVASRSPQLLEEPTTSIRTLAGLWENLASLEEGEDKAAPLINAALTYEIAGYQANSACIAKYLRAYADRRVASVTDLLSLFLERRFLQALVLSKEIQSEPPVDGLSREQIVEALGRASLSDGIASSVRFFLSGDRDWLDRAADILRRAHRIFSALALVRETNLVQLLLSLIPLLEQRSTWRVLENLAEEIPLWKRYLKLLARGTAQDVLDSRSISEFWPSQIIAINNGVLDLDTSKVIRMPTSAGKTLIAELAIVSVLLRNPGAKCVYVAPYRALVSEVEESLVGVLGDLGFQVSSVLGMYEEDEFEGFLLADADVLVITPEKLDMVLRTRPDFIEACRLFVLDEGQIVDDAQRGVKAELLVTRLRRRLPEAKFLLISAVVPRDTLNHFAQWFGATPDDVVWSDWRPSIQRYARLEWRRESGTLRFMDGDVGGTEFLEFVPGIVRQENYEYVNENTGRRRTESFPTTNKSQLAAALASKVADEGSVLVFCSQTNFLYSVARALAKKIQLDELTEKPVPGYLRTGRGTRSWTLAREWLGEEHLVTRMLASGIAVHHGRLPDVIRTAIENDFRERRYRIIIATSTLAQGVNLPIRTVIFHSCWRHDPAVERQVRISARDYWNIAGRAGRAGEETDGLIVHIVRNQRDLNDVRYYFDRRSDVEPVKGALFRYMVDLANERISESEVRSAIDSEVLALLAEEAIEVPDIGGIQDFLMTSLLGRQVESDPNTRPSLEQLSNLFAHTFEDISNRVPSPEERLVFSGTGLTTDSAIRIKEAVLSAEQTARDLLRAEDLEELDALIDHIVPVCIELPELASDRDFGGEIEALVKAWLRGTGISELYAEFSESIGDLESLGRFIDDVFRYRLPWSVSGYIRIAASVLDIDRDEVGILPRYLPSMIKFGVPDPVAAWAMTTGIPLRSLAIQLAASYRSRTQQSDYASFREWLGRFSSEQLMRDFGVQAPLLRDVSRSVMTVSRNSLLAQYSDVEDALPITTEVVGTRYEDDRITAAHLTQVGDRATLVRDYGNAFDRNAISVQTSRGDVGFVPRTLAQFLAPDMDAGTALESEVIEIVRDRIPQISIRIALVG